MNAALEIELLGRVVAEQVAMVLTTKFDAVARRFSEADAQTSETNGQVENSSPACLTVKTTEKKLGNLAANS